MIVPETKSIYIQTRHELGREWECIGCGGEEWSGSGGLPPTPDKGVSWAPIQTDDETYEYVIYDSSSRGTEGGTMMGIYFEDTYPINHAYDYYEGYPFYFNEVNVYKQYLKGNAENGFHWANLGMLSAVPVEMVQIFADEEAAGAKELSLGVFEIGQNQGRTYYEGLGGRGYPVTVQKNDKLVLRPVFLEGEDLLVANPEAVAAGHQRLYVLPARGNLPCQICDNEVGGSCKGTWGLGSYEEWSRRFYLNVIVDIVETKMVEQIIE